MKKLLSCLCCLFLCLHFTHGETKVYTLTKDSLNNVHYSANISRFLLYNASDSAKFSLPGTSDNHWNRDTISEFHKVCWFRFHFRVSDEIYAPLCFLLNQQGNTQLFLDGRPLNIASASAGPFILTDRIIPFRHLNDREHVLAVRYTNADASMPTLDLELADLNARLVNERQNQIDQVLLVLAIFFLSIGFIHFLIYYFYRVNRSNLFFCLFSALLGIYIFNAYVSFGLEAAWAVALSSLVAGAGIQVVIISLLLLIYSLFFEKYPRAFRYFAALSFFALFMELIDSYWTIVTTPLATLVISIEILRTVIIAVKQKKKASRIIGRGVIIFISMVLLLLLLAAGVIVFTEDHHVTVNLEWIGLIGLLLVLVSILSIPVSTSVYLARDFAETNTQLLQKLSEVEFLSARTIEQEKEKQKILESQKEVLEIQVAERTAELAEKNKDITDSIKYAKRIQEAMLPNAENVLQHLPESFILYQPKDIISGDFYWFSEKGDRLFVAAADCTGHGVPGALMSMIGSTLLNEIINEKGIYEPGKILYQLREGIIRSLKQTGAEGESRDGMDIALCVIDRAASTVVFAGANNPLWIIRNEKPGELLEIKGDKQPIGIYAGEPRPFTPHALPLQKGDILYLFSDGYADQFGGPKGKKFKYTQLQQLLLASCHLPMQEQKTTLHEAFETWKEHLEQIDDVLVIGIRI